MARIGVVLNANAAGGRAGRRFARYRERLGRDHVLDVRRTAGPGHASALARALADDGVDAVVAVGGDGTLHEVVNGLLPRATRPPLGVLPLGTGNSFARDLGLHVPEAALEGILTGGTRAVDVVRVEDEGGRRWSINLVSLGFTAAVGAMTNRRFKPLGPSGYALATVASLVRLAHPPFPHALDDGLLDDSPITLLSFCNSRCTGGTMQMAPGASLGDGLLDVVRVGRMGRRRLLSVFPRIYAGTHVTLPEVSVARASRVRLALAGPTDVMIDGEVVRFRPTELVVEPAAIEILA